MRAASDLPSSYLSRPSWQSRAAGFLLALGTVALIVLMLIQIGLLPAGQRLLQPPTIVELLPEPKPKIASPAPKTLKVRHAAKAAAAPPVQEHKAPPPKTPPVPWNVIPMTSAEFAAADISKLPAHGRTGAAQGSADSGSGKAGDGQGKGEGGGDEIYDVDWYQKPPRGVMASYMSRVTAQSGWGEIKCRMIDHYHVEDCAELGESPPGSGFSRALRQAAWQFLVRPPRINGKPLLGTWVRIHFDFLPTSNPADAG